MQMVSKYTLQYIHNQLVFGLLLSSGSVWELLNYNPSGVKFQSSTEPHSCIEMYQGMNTTNLKDNW